MRRHAEEAVYWALHEAASHLSDVGVEAGGLELLVAEDVLNEAGDAQSTPAASIT